MENLNFAVVPYGDSTEPTYFESLEAAQEFALKKFKAARFRDSHYSVIVCTDLADNGKWRNCKEVWNTLNALVDTFIVIRHSKQQCETFTYYDSENEALKRAKNDDFTLSVLEKDEGEWIEVVKIISTDLNGAPNNFHRIWKSESF